MLLTADRARELVSEGLSAPIVGPDGRAARLVVADDQAQLWRLDAAGALEGVAEQPVAWLPDGDTTEERYGLLVEGIRRAIARALESGADELYPADLVQPDILLDPRVTTAEHVAAALTDPVALADAVGPHQVGVYLRERGLAPVPDATAARIHRLWSDDLAVARDAARELVRERDRAAIPAVLATLESWVEFVEDPVWFELGGANAHVALANAVSPLVGAAESPEERRRVVALLEAGLITGGSSSATGGHTEVAD